MNTSLYLFEIPEENIETESKMVSYLSQDKQNILNNYQNCVSRRTSLYAEVFLRCKIIELLGIRNSEIIFEHNKFGKPYLKGYPDFHFNISHSHEAVAIGFSDVPIGVDIEKMRKCNMSLAGKFFTDEENTYIDECKKTDTAFFEIWTKKEAYLKYDGVGLSCDFSTISVFEENIRHLTQTHFWKDYVVSICCGNKNIKIFKVRNISEVNQMLNSSPLENEKVISEVIPKC